MALLTFTPPVAPSPGTKRNVELKLLKADFGDGYSQTSRDGINHIRKVFALKWDVLTYGQAKIISDFLEARGGDQAFLYQHANTTAPIRVTCEEWSQDDQAAGLCSFTATFKQDANIYS